MVTQNRNKRDTILIKDPKPPHHMIPVAELAQRMQIPYQVLRYRLKVQGTWPGDITAPAPDEEKEP
jgi:hypothetical protein